MRKRLRIYLRAFEPEDYLKIHKWRKDKEIAKNFGGVPLFSSSLNEKKWVEDRIFDKTNMSCAICIKETDEFVGCIFLNNIDQHNMSASTPLFIGEKKHWGKGYAEEAKIIMLNYAFNDRGLIRIADTMIETNKGSIKLHEKVGYKQEGILRKARYKDGQHVNAIQMAALKEDFIKCLEDYEL